jgi:hypothetical protein
VYTSPNWEVAEVSKFKTWTVWHNETDENTTNILVAYYRGLKHLTPIIDIEALVL